MSRTWTLLKVSLSIMAGLMIFPIVFTFGIAPDSGSSLSFTALPMVFSQMAGGTFVGIAFYLLLFVAAFTSCVAMLEVVLATFRDELRISQKWAAVLAVVLTFAIGIPSALSFTSLGLTINGRPFLDIMDLITGSGVVIVAGIVGAALICWLVKRAQILEGMNASDWKLWKLRVSPQWIIWVGRYLPIAAVALLIARLLV